MNKKRFIITTILSLTMLICSSNVYAFTNTDLMGEYSLVGFTIQYQGGDVFTQDNASSFSGHASITTKGFVVEMDGYVSGSHIQHYNCAFYTISGDRIYASIAGGGSGYIDIQISGESFITSGYDSDSDGNYFGYTYIWIKNESYYTQGQIDQVISDAVTKDQTISDLNQALLEKDQTISDLNDTIAQKNQTISELSDFNSDGRLDLKDIIWGLQVLTGQRF